MATTNDDTMTTNPDTMTNTPDNNPDTPDDPEAPVMGRLEIACAIARCEMEPLDDEDALVRLRAARANYSARGRCNEHWYRMVSGPGAIGWTYFADDRLRPVDMLAATRDQTTYGTVAIGDMIAQHDRGGPVTVIYLVVNRGPKPLKRCSFVRKSGFFEITLPDGSVITKVDPRGRGR